MSVNYKNELKLNKNINSSFQSIYFPKRNGR